MTIEIGVVVVQDANNSSGYTLVQANHPASGSGTITAVSFEVETQVETLTIIIMELVAANTYTARSYQILGTKAAGLHSDVAVSLAVVEGDYIAYYYSAGAMYHLNAGGAGGTGEYYKAGDQKECVAEAFSLNSANGQLYLYGTGAGEAVGGGADMAAVEAILAGEL